LNNSKWKTLEKTWRAPSKALWNPGFALFEGRDSGFLYSKIARRRSHDSGLKGYEQDACGIPKIIGITALSENLHGFGWWD